MGTQNPWFRASVILPPHGLEILLSSADFFIIHLKCVLNWGQKPILQINQLGIFGLLVITFFQVDNILTNENISKLKHT